jgi:hypothetical protein
MKEQPNAFLAIGGPWDGKRVARADQGLGFKVVKHQRYPTILSSQMEACVPATVETVTYLADRVSCSRLEEDQVWFWRPADQSLKETLSKLLERYEQSANINFQESPFRHY